MGTPKLRSVVGVFVTSAAVGSLVMALARVLNGWDPAKTLASTIGLSSGVLLGAVLGGVVGVWLVVGGRGRIAVFTGFLLSVAAMILIWRWVRPHTWVVDTFMIEAFGDGGEQYSGIVILSIGFIAFRTLQRAAIGLAAAFLARAS